MLGCLHASQDFAHNDVDACLQKNTSLFINLYQCSIFFFFFLTDTNTNLSRVAYLFPKTFKDLFPSATRLLTVFNHLVAVQTKAHQLRKWNECVTVYHTRCHCLVIFRWTHKIKHFFTGNLLLRNTCIYLTEVRQGLWGILICVWRIWLPSCSITQDKLLQYS